MKFGVVTKVSTSSLGHKLLVITEEAGERVDPHLVVNMANTKQQHGTKECGVFE